MLYRAVALAPADAAKLGLQALDTTTDSARSISPDAFAQSSAERKASMIVQAKTVGMGIDAEIDAKQSGFCVMSVPFEHNMRITVDGMDVPTYVSNFGFVGFLVGSGKHNVVLRRI